MEKAGCIIIGGGAAGFFAAAHLSEASLPSPVLLLEASSKFLSKVKVSGGGRCNVTHHCFDARELSQNYPRGQRELLGPLSRFQPRDTVRWFEDRGVPLITEADGRMFPHTHSSQTIVDCLVRASSKVELRKKTRVLGLEASPQGLLVKTDSESLLTESVILTTGGARPGFELASGLGHTIIPPVPSLFTFHIDHPLLKDLAGLSFSEVQLRLRTQDGKKFEQRGPLLITHQGVSGPAVLKLSAFAARSLHAQDYRAELEVALLPGLDMEAWISDQAPTLTLKRLNPGLPKRFWERLLSVLGLEASLQLANLSKAQRGKLLHSLENLTLPIHGKSLNKEEFVTCGGIKLREVNLKTMESKLVPGLHFAGEVLDIDGVTGGFNFQNAWTTAHLAATAVASKLSKS